ncbi:ABC transporter permease subunit [Aureimonas fodinaquatilis]|uniref:ABC transporter permease subunit n=1 Tax=Aureimonas fodinaquatilis TaxID=2565783 RepID=A0A5B0DYI8_9HYPH|nr:ABC transporter permease subunit [Aureimonas fodinaquatilis]KAA0971573.1 ABC transporter permease subunit [Aureimonas fodinaquatilis]
MDFLTSFRFDGAFDRTVDDGIDWLNDNLAFLFDAIRAALDSALFALNWALSMPWWLFVTLTVAASWRLSGLGLALFAAIALAMCQAAGLWEMLIETLALVILATLIALAIGIPLGILGARWRRFGKVLEPAMDTLQTLPPYVYLLPAIALIGFGGASAVVATMILAVPPTVRLTMLGIRHIPTERIELARSLGATSTAQLVRVELPSAMPSILAGVNQSLMMALGMAVIAGIIGAGGLGSEVYRAVRYLEIGRAVDAGLAIVVLSILLDRLSAGIAERFLKTGGTTRG